MFSADPAVKSAWSEREQVEWFSRFTVLSRRQTDDIRVSTPAYVMTLLYVYASKPGKAVIKVFCYSLSLKADVKDIIPVLTCCSAGGLKGCNLV